MTQIRFSKFLNPNLTGYSRDIIKQLEKAVKEVIDSYYRKLGILPPNDYARITYIEPEILSNHYFITQLVNCYQHLGYTLFIEDGFYCVENILTIEDNDTGDTVIFDLWFGENDQGVLEFGISNDKCASVFIDNHEYMFDELGKYGCAWVIFDSNGAIIRYDKNLNKWFNDSIFVVPKNVLSSTNIEHKRSLNPHYTPKPKEVLGHIVDRSIYDSSKIRVELILTDLDKMKQQIPSCYRNPFVAFLDEETIEGLELNYVNDVIIYFKLGDNQYLSFEKDNKEKDFWHAIPRWFDKRDKKFVVTASGGFFLDGTNTFFPVKAACIPHRLREQCNEICNRFLNKMNKLKETT